MKAKKFKALAIEIAEQMNDGGIEKDRRTLENLGIAVAEYIKPDLRFDNSYAVAEGWGLFDVDTSDGPAKQIQRCDDSKIFASDSEAVAFVRRLAKAGSRYHAEALGRDLDASEAAAEAETSRWVLSLSERGHVSYWAESPSSRKLAALTGNWGKFEDATIYVEPADAHTEAQRIMRMAQDFTMQIKVCREADERSRLGL